MRHEKSRPTAELLKAWCQKAQVDNLGLPKGPLMEGVTYVLNQWATLERFLQDGTIREISNNGCERALHPVVIGRNNWLYFGSEEGTRGSLVLMSLVQSCKELGVSPLGYIHDVMLQINQVPASRVHELTPLGYEHNAEAAVRAPNARRDLVARCRQLEVRPLTAARSERSPARLSRCRCLNSYVLASQLFAALRPLPEIDSSRTPR